MKRVFEVGDAFRESFELPLSRDGLRVSSTVISAGVFFVALGAARRQGRKKKPFPPERERERETQEENDKARGDAGWKRGRASPRVLRSPEISRSQKKKKKKKKRAAAWK